MLSVNSRLLCAITHDATERGAYRNERSRAVVRSACLLICVCPRRWQGSRVAHCPGLVEPDTKWSLTAETDVRSACAVARCIISSVPNPSSFQERWCIEEGKSNCWKHFLPFRSACNLTRSKILELLESETVLFVPVWGFRFAFNVEVSYLYVHGWDYRDLSTDYGIIVQT